MKLTSHRQIGLCSAVWICLNLFVPAVMAQTGTGSGMTIIVPAAPAHGWQVTPKDGPGAGANSWIGYKAGSNQATGAGSAVAAGKFNLASGQGAFVGAGTSNQANGISSLVIGGFDNRATAIDSVVIGGAGHRSTGARSFIGGGGYNLASGAWSVIVGGGRDGVVNTPAGTDLSDNIATGNFSFIGGGQGNVTFDDWTTIGGGFRNLASSFYGTVGGGTGNHANADRSTVGGGAANTASAPYATVAGGGNNTASGGHSYVGGGIINRASANGSAIGGGSGNTASGENSTVGGGDQGTASGFRSTIGGGSFNTASGHGGTVGGGSGNTASGYGSTVGGGSGNTASGDYSWAGGSGAKTQTAGAVPVVHHGTFVWADSISLEFNSSAANQFNVRATGGVRLVTAIDVAGTPTAGVSLASGDSSWGVLSDRAAKDNWRIVDGRDVLERVVAMPVARWNYRMQSAAIEHMGPSAQDFRAAFGLGHGDRTIATVDADGVALAAIQGLNAKLEASLAAKDAELAVLKHELHELRRITEQLLAHEPVERRIAIAE